jgi:hypothetical protein
MSARPRHRLDNARNIVAAHLHRGAPNTLGPIIVRLLPKWDTNQNILSEPVNAASTFYASSDLQPEGLETNASHPYNWDQFIADMAAGAVYCDAHSLAEQPTQGTDVPEPPVLRGQLAGGAPLLQQTVPTVVSVSQPPIEESSGARAVAGGAVALAVLLVAVAATALLGA